MNEYKFPPITLLNSVKSDNENVEKVEYSAKKLQNTLYSLGINAKVQNVLIGPTFITYQIKLGIGVRVNKIKSLKDDLALSLETEITDIKVNVKNSCIDIICIRNERKTVSLREIILSEKFINSKSKLTIALGKNIYGEDEIADLKELSHILISGTTGSGCSIFLHTLINSFIFKAKPSEVKLLMIDPKVSELSVYNGITHLLIPVVTDIKKAMGALAWAIQEMEKRYKIFAEKRVRNIEDYNALAEKECIPKLPRIVIIIDEFADLMMYFKEYIEESIYRLSQMSREAGMHLVIVTQRPSNDVITGIIKANIPTRISFLAPSQVDSRTILDRTGAEDLLGKGDMLFYKPGTTNLIRIQGAYISEKEVENVVEFLRQEDKMQYDVNLIELIEKSGENENAVEDDEEYDDADPLLNEAIEAVIETGIASTSFIQRRFKLGYARAGRIIDQMEQRGIISGYQGSEPREVLMSKERWNEVKN